MTGLTAGTVGESQQEAQEQGRVACTQPSRAATTAD